MTSNGYAALSPLLLLLLLSSFFFFFFSLVVALPCACRHSLSARRMDCSAGASGAILSSWSRHRTLYSLLTASFSPTTTMALNLSCSACRILRERVVLSTRASA